MAVSSVSSSSAALSSPGLGSGLDINGIVTKLMAVEQLPLTQLNTKEAGLQAKLSAYGSLKGALSSFQDAVAALTSTAKFSALKASVADATVIGASATSIAATGSYSVEVTSLAQSQTLKSGTFTTTSDALGSGTITIEFGTYSGGAFTLNPDKAAKTITVSATQDSLSGVRDAINAAGAGVQASIINDGTGNRLVLTSRDTGAANALRIGIADDDGNNSDNAGLSQLVYDASTGGTKNLTQAVAAQDAAFTVNGIVIAKASNTVTDAIQGVTLNLLKTNSGSPTTVTVSRDSSGVRSAVESFVKAYNDTISFIKQLTAYNADTKTAAVLQGDSSTLSIAIQLRSVLNSALGSAGGGLSALSDIGVSFQKDGTLSLDSTKLQAAVDDPAKDISTLFAAVGKPSDSLVQFVGAGADTKAGRYTLDVTQLATQGKALGSAVAGTTITAGVNDTLVVTVDGNAATVTLAAGTYTAATLAAEIQSRINGAGAISDAGAAVTVSQSGGVLTLTSDSYGSASSVQINSGNAVSDLFGTATATAGVDVAGTINGAAAIGSGQKLKMASGDANGLEIMVTGGAAGDRGTIAYAQGYAYQLNQLLDRILGTSGQITSRTDGINNSIKDIGERREVLQKRLSAIEARYRAQFNALDSMIASLNQTSTFLTQQLASLPGSAK